MPLDTSIPLQAKFAPVNYEVQQPLNTLVSAMKLKQLSQESDEYERARKEEADLRNYLATKPDLSNPETRTNMLGYGKTGAAYAKSLSEQETAALSQREKQFTIQKARKDFVAQAQRDTSQNPSDANITAYKEDLLANPLFTEAEKTQMAAAADRILAMPVAERKTFMSSQGASASELKPHITTQDLGGSTRIMSTPAFGGAATVVPGSAAGKTMTPGESARLAAETATGTLTPESLDVAANVYLQTGQLPTGLGKAAAGLRTQVMNRATELSSGKPAAEVAGGIVESKQDVASRGKAVKDFSTGMQGRQVNSFNTAIDHLGTMDKLADALGNGDLKAINSIGNVIARQTGQPAPVNFDAAKQIVTAEVVKSIVNNGGSKAEREEAADKFASANSPEQLKGVINTYKQLMGGQLKSLKLQYENTTGRKDFDSKLTGEAKNVVKELSGGQSSGTQTGKLSPAEQAELEQLRARFKK